MERPTKSFRTRWASNCSRLRAEGNDSLRSAAACTPTTPPSAGRCSAPRSETSSRGSKGGLMEELDFSKPAREPVRAPAYDPAVALEFFRSAGKHEEVPAGTRIFSENEKASRFFLQSDKMYYLLEGEVTLLVQGKPVRSVTPGQIFGEWAAFSESPRSATALARAACRVISLDGKGFQAALRSNPEFALMLMGHMIGRLRAMLGQLTGIPSAASQAKESRVFDKGLLAALVKGLGDSAIARYDRGQVIMVQGQTGALMYVVLEGRVAISLRGSVVQHVGPGGVFGE